MKALSLTQPWASLVAIKAMRIETRSWWTPYRGPLAIHAAKGYPVAARELVETEPFWSPIRAAKLHQYNLPLGAVVAVARLVAVREIYVTREGVIGLGRDPKALHDHAREGETGLVNATEEAFGDYHPGRFAWVLDQIIGLAEPTPARGALGLWEWTPPVSDAVVLPKAIR